MGLTKVTFSLDDETVRGIERVASRLGLSKSGVVREAVREYAARVGQLSEGERQRLLGIFDELVPAIPERSAESVDQEIADVRAARRRGGRSPTAETE